MNAIKQARFADANAALAAPTTANTWASVFVRVLFVVGCVGLLWRVWQLGAFGLTPAEAAEAMAAWRLIQPVPGTAAPAAQSGLLQSVLYFLFSIFTAGEWQARLLPALAGTVVIFFPLLWRKQLGDLATVLAVALLAFSATFTAAARMVDGSMLGWACLFGVLWQLQAYEQDRSEMHLNWASALLGLGLCSASSFWQGALVLGVLHILAGWLGLPQLLSIGQDTFAALQRQWLRLLLLLVVACVGGSTMLFFVPGGLSSSGASLSAWAMGWLSPSGSPWWQPLSLLFLYEPGALLLGTAAVLWGVVHGNRLLQTLGVWALLALLLNVGYLGKHATDVLWVVMPLVLAAAILLADVIAVGSDWLEVSAQALVLTLIMLVFGAFLLGFVRLLTEVGGVFDWSVWMSDITKRAYVVVLVLCALMLPVTVALFALGWSSDLAWRAVILASAVALGYASLSASVRLNQPASEFIALEAWHTAQPNDAAVLLHDIIGDTSVKAVGNKTEMKLVAVGDVNGVLGWALRNYPHVSWQAAPTNDPQAASMQILAPDVAIPEALSAGWVGTKLALTQQLPTEMTPAQRLNYWLYRIAPAQRGNYTIWVDPDVQLLRNRTINP